VLLKSRVKQLEQTVEKLVKHYNEVTEENANLKARLAEERAPKQQVASQIDTSGGIWARK
jgi:regulator of replication initiation timing